LIGGFHSDRTIPNIAAIFRQELSQLINLLIICVMVADEYMSSGHETSLSEGYFLSSSVGSCLGSLGLISNSRQNISAKSIDSISC
jgi:hypothetical protein